MDTHQLAMAFHRKAVTFGQVSETKTPRPSLTSGKDSVTVSFGNSLSLFGSKSPLPATPLFIGEPQFSGKKPHAGRGKGRGQNDTAMTLYYDSGGE